ncbi:MAG: ABC transporter ATP-binding protein [candidate division WOR-3 bacterium]
MNHSLGISIKNLRKVFQTNSNEPLIALDNINLEIAPHSFTCIIGATGCGKTTLLRIIAGLEKPTDGIVLIGNQVVNGPRSDTTLVFQQYSLFPWRNVIDNVAFGLEVQNIPQKERYEKAMQLLSMMSLTNFAHHRPYELSGGMQQRVAIARALALDPSLLLLDEPFGALDERTRHRLQDELLSIWEKTKKTILFVTHNIDEAVYLAERVVIMADRPSRIADDIKINIARPRNRLAQEFVEMLLRVRSVLENTMSQDREEINLRKGGKNEKNIIRNNASCCGR